MRKLIMLATIVVASSASGQTPVPARPLGSWEIEYEWTIVRMHAGPIITKDRARVTLRSVGDSVLGDLVMISLADSAKSLLRGTAKSGLWTLYVEEPRPQGLSILMIPIEAAMDWLKETVHGVQPTVVRFELGARGGSLTGTRTVTGFPSNNPRTAAVRGVRRQ